MPQHTNEKLTQKFGSMQISEEGSLATDRTQSNTTSATVTPRTKALGRVGSNVSAISSSHTKSPGSPNIVSSPKSRRTNDNNNKNKTNKNKKNTSNNNNDDDEYLDVATDEDDHEHDHDDDDQSAENKKEKEKKKTPEEVEAEKEISNIVGSAFDPLLEDQNVDDAIDDLFPRHLHVSRLHLRGHSDVVKSCCFDAHHRLLFTASWDGVVLVWNLELFTTPIARLHHREWINAVATTYVPDLTVVTVTEDGYLFGWQSESYMIEKSLFNNKNDKNDEAGAEKEKTSSSSAENSKREEETDHNKIFHIIAQIQIAYGALTTLAVHSDYNFAFTSCGETTFGVHLSSGSVLREYVTNTDVSCLAAVDAVLCIAQVNGTITVYDIVGSFILRELTGHLGSVRCMSVVDSYTVMSAGDDCSIRVWNLASGACQSNRRRVHTRPITCITHFYTERDRLVVSAGLDGLVKVTKQSNGGVVATFGMMCSALTIIPPIPIDASNLEEVVDMLSQQQQHHKEQQQQQFSHVAGTDKLWEEAQVEYTASAIFEMKNATTDHHNDNMNMSSSEEFGGPLSPLLALPGVSEEAAQAAASSVPRAARWSFFQTLVCGSHSGRLTRLSLEAAAMKDVVHMS